MCLVYLHLIHSNDLEAFHLAIEGSDSIIIILINTSTSLDLFFKPLLITSHTDILFTVCLCVDPYYMKVLNSIYSLIISCVITAFQCDMHNSFYDFLSRNKCDPFFRFLKYLMFTKRLAFGIISNWTDALDCKHVHCILDNKGQILNGSNKLSLFTRQCIWIGNLVEVISYQLACQKLRYGNFCK